MNNLESFLSHLENLKRYSEHTIKNYKVDLIQFKEYSKLHNLTIEECSSSIIRSWVIELMDKGLSEKSINRKISSLKSYFKYLKKNGIVHSDPMLKVKTPKVPKRLPVYVDQVKMEKILDDPSIGELSFRSAREMMVINLLYHTGIRRSELIGLNEKDIDFHQKTIKVLGKGGKERIIPVSDTLLIELNRYLSVKKNEFGDVTPTLIVTDRGKKAYPKLIYNIVSKILRKYNASEKVSPHILRHTFATHLTATGAELNAVKELLGHASLAATQVYTHNSIERLKKVYDSAHPKSKS